MGTTYVEFPDIFNGIEVTMRQGFEIFGLEIRWYAILIVTGIILAFIFAIRNCKKFGFIPDDLYDGILIGIPTGVIGARLYFVLFSGQRYDSLKDIIDMSKGGLAIYGAFIAVAIMVPIFAKIKKLNLLAIMDAVCMGFILAQGIGRWGNFINGECYGGESSLPWRMIIKVYSGSDTTGFPHTTANYVHPTFLYESLLCITGFILFYIFLKKTKNRFNGQIMCFYFIWYGLGRALIEGLRTDSLYIGNSDIRVSQLVGILMFVGGLFVLIFVLLRRKKLGIYGLPVFAERVVKQKEKKNKKEDETPYVSIIGDEGSEEPKELETENSQAEEDVEE